MNALNVGARPAAIAMPDDRFGQACIRVALRQLKAGDATSAGLSAWFATHDSGQMPDDESEESPR